MSRPSPALKKSSSWSMEEIESFLETAVIPIRLAFLTQKGTPLVTSLWFFYEEGRIHCATQESARLLPLLEQNPDVAFEIAGDAMPYRGVRGQGRVTLSRTLGETTLRRLMARYLDDTQTPFARWLETRAATDVALVIEPGWLTSWDFSSRMGDS